MSEWTFLKRLKIGYKKLGPIQKTLFILGIISLSLAIISLLLSIISDAYFFWADIKSEERDDILFANQEEMKTLILQNQNTHSVTASDLPPQFQDYYTVSTPNDLNCIPNVNFIDGSVLIDNCDILYKPLNLDGSSGYAVHIKFKPNWDLDEYSEKYFIDIMGGFDSEKNHISLYFENGFLKYRIKNYDGSEEHILKIGLFNETSWNINGFNDVEIAWVDNRMRLYLNGKESNKVVGNIDINLSNSYLFLGSSIFGDKQANGYFDYMFIRKYVYPEPSWTVGPAQYYAGSLHYNSTIDYQNNVESDGTITGNRSTNYAINTNDIAGSSGYSNVIIKVFDNSAEIPRVFSISGDNLSWYQVADLTPLALYELFDSKGLLIETQTTNNLGIANFTVNLSDETYKIIRNYNK